MTEASSIFVRLGGEDVGLSTLLTQVDKKAQVAADSALRLQAQYARLAQASGNTSQATNILTNALQNNGGASAGVVTSIATQAAQLQNGSSAFQQFGASAASSLTGLIGPAALATAAIGGLVAVGKSFADAFEFKTKLDQSTASIKILLQGVRESGEVFAGAARFAAQYKLTQAETTEAIQSSIPVIRNSKASIEEVLGVFARLKVLKPEKSFGDAARALGELQAGQIVSIVDQFNLSRTAANQMKDEIAKGGDAVQILSQYLTTAGVGMSALDVQTQGAAGKMRELAKAQEDLTLAQAQFAQGPGMAILQERIALTSGVTRVLSGDFAAMGQAIAATVTNQQAAASAYNAYMSALSAGKTQTEAAAAGEAARTAALQAGAVASQAAADADAAWAQALAQTGTVLTGVTDIEQQRIAALNASAAIAQQAAAAQLGYANSLAFGGVQARAAAAAAQLKGDADQVAAVDAQTHAVAQQKLAEAAQKAAAFLVINGAAGARTAALLAGSSSQVDVLTAAYYRLAIAQQVAKTDDPLKGVTEDRLTRDTTGDRAQVKSDQALAANQKLLATINKQTRAGGGAKLSDQQKLNNQLLTDQDKADTQYEDLEAQHQQTLLKIQIDFAKKTLEQQKLNEVSKRQSQADFYDRLTSSELNKKKGGSDALKQIDSDYQAAYQKSQQLAQAGNAKLAADYLALKSKQAADELTYQENLAKAAADKDKAEVSRLQAIHKLRQDANAEEEKQLLSGGDANVNAKQQALDDEAAKYDDAQGKIGTSAERAADRQIAAADRAGKKIDEVQTKLTGLKSTYDQIAPAGGGSGTTAGGSAPPAASTTTPVAASADPIAAAIAQLQDAITAKLDSVRSAADGTTSAVRGLQGKFAS